MGTLTLNQTPVRTSRNFHINNIKLENEPIPEKIGKFHHVEITGENEKISVNNIREEKTCQLVYG